MVFKLYTERRENLPHIVSQYFPGFTLYPAIGYWKGEGEESMVIEVVELPSAEGKVRELAETIKLINNQQSVLMSVEGESRRVFV